MSRVRADPITTALVHPTRRSIYVYLSQCEEMSTVQLQDAASVDRYNLYHHLKKLSSIGLIENHRDQGRARWWRVATVVNLPEIVTLNTHSQQSQNIISQPVNLSDGNSFIIPLDDSRSKIGAKLLFEKLAHEIGIELNLPWNFVPQKIALVGEI